MEANVIPKRVYIYEFGNNKIESRPKSRWHYVREDTRIVGGEGWQKKVYNREEWNKLLRTARNHRILRMLME
jgi:hypothetical protein